MKSTRREKYLAIGLAVFATSAAILWKPIQHCWLGWLVLRAEAPAQSLVEELLARDQNPGSLLKKLWNTQKIPHRLAALEYLQTHHAATKELKPEDIAILVDAASGGDVEAKDIAFTVLSNRQHPEVNRLALAQLRDVDPAVRVIGLQQLARTGDRQLVPAIISLINDPDPRVVTAAGHTLRKWTGNDFGLHFSLAQPDFKSYAASNTDMALLSEGVTRWMDWWKVNQAEYPQSQPLPPPSSLPCQLPTPDFSLPDLAGNQTRLSSFQGKPVLLIFWATTITNSIPFLSWLGPVQSRNADNFSIIAIALDGSDLAAPHHCGGHDDEPPEHCPEKSTTGKIDSHGVRRRVAEFAQQHGISLPVLLDSSGDIGRRFSAFELPTNVILDRAGEVRRRFIGPRAPATMEAMLISGDTPELNAREPREPVEP